MTLVMFQRYVYCIQDIENKTFSNCIPLNGLMVKGTDYCGESALEKIYFAKAY